MKMEAGSLKTINKLLNGIEKQLSKDLKMLSFNLGECMTMEMGLLKTTNKLLNGIEKQPRVNLLFLNSTLGLCMR